jgi:transcription initiation factor TFIIIB Brf1 subunit/transcription initiation factor TFIIB
MSKNCECGTKENFVEDYDNGVIRCTKCGMIIEGNLIDYEYEKRTSESDDHEIKRVGPPSKPGQTTEPGNVLIIRENGHTRKRVIYTKQTKINKNFNRIQELLSKAGAFSNLIEKTKEAYKDLAKIKNFQGRNLTHIIIALFYYVSRKENNLAKSLKEVAKMFPLVTEREIKKAFNDIKEDAVEYDDEDELAKVEKNLIQNYIGRNMEKYEAKKLSYKIIENINNNAMLEGKSPTTVAGLSLMLSYKLLNDNSDNMKDFYSTFATKGTLTRTFKQIDSQLDKVIPNEYFDKIEDLKKCME